MSEICINKGFRRHTAAPRRGAWIETNRSRNNRPEGGAAPRRGAWIETYHRQEAV